MTSKQFAAIIAAMRTKQDDLLLKKGKEYSGDEDVLNNFKSVGAEIGIDPFRVWAVFATKHMRSIMRFVKTGRVESEPIESRITDLINYLYFLQALLAEKPSE